jgi:GTPase SAR1 family protein
MSSPSSLSSYVFKVAVLGECGVGKSALVRRWVHAIATPHYRPTHAADRATLLIPATTTTTSSGGDGRAEGEIVAAAADGDGSCGDVDVRVQFWDVGGQERFGGSGGGGGGDGGTALYYRGCAGVVLVCDRTRPGTLAALHQWLADMAAAKRDDQRRQRPQHSHSHDDDDDLETQALAEPEMLLIANKTDLVEGTTASSNDRAIDEAVRELCETHGLTRLAWHACSTRTGAGTAHALDTLVHAMVRAAQAQGIQPIRKHSPQQAPPQPQPSPPPSPGPRLFTGFRM